MDRTVAPRPVSVNVHGVRQGSDEDGFADDLALAHQSQRLRRLLQRQAVGHVRGDPARGQPAHEHGQVPSLARGVEAAEGADGEADRLRVLDQQVVGR